MGVVPGLVGVRVLAGPQSEPVVVLGREHDVAGARPGEEVGPLRKVCLGTGLVELRDEAVVRKAQPVRFGMMSLGPASWDLDSVEVPLRVGVVLEEVPRPPLGPEL